jgi:hypothetical protein
MDRRELLKASVAAAAVSRQERTAFAAPAGNIQVEIEAAKSGKPINPMIFGGYMGPATMLNTTATWQGIRPAGTFRINPPPEIADRTAWPGLAENRTWFAWSLRCRTGTAW